jgi:hypothetical protein
MEVEYGKAGKVDPMSPFTSPPKPKPKATAKKATKKATAKKATKK